MPRPTFRITYQEGARSHPQRAPRSSSMTRTRTVEAPDLASALHGVRTELGTTSRLIGVEEIFETTRLKSISDDEILRYLKASGITPDLEDSASALLGEMLAYACGEIIPSFSGFLWSDGSVATLSTEGSPDWKGPMRTADVDPSTLIDTDATGNAAAVHVVRRIISAVEEKELL